MPRYTALKFLLPHRIANFIFGNGIYFFMAAHRKYTQKNEMKKKDEQLTAANQLLMDGYLNARSDYEFIFFTVAQIRTDALGWVGRWVGVVYGIL